MDFLKFLLFNADLPLVKQPNLGPPHPRGGKEQLGKISDKVEMFVMVCAGEA